MIEAPNELEVNHAFTRKMTHLLCVVSHTTLLSDCVQHPLNRDHR